MLEGLKDENGQLKKPVLFSLIGGGGLVAYLLVKGKGGSSSGTSSTGQTTPLTPDLTGLQGAIDALLNASGGGPKPNPKPNPDPIPNPKPIQHTKLHRATMSDLLSRLSLHQLHVYDKQGLKALVPLLDPSQLHLLHLINKGGYVPTTTTKIVPIGHYSAQDMAGDGGNSGGGGAGILSIGHAVSRSGGVYAGLASPYQPVKLASLVPTRTR